MRHDGFAGSIRGQISQRQGRNHENNRCNGGRFAQKRRCPGVAKKCLTGPASERCPHIGAFAGLKQHDHDKRYTDNDMNNNQ